MVHKLINSAVCTCLVLVSLNVNAALISGDWKMEGDNLITRDDFGKEWLDLTVTTDQSYNSIIGKFGIGQQYEGWRYAALSEINNLWISAGADSNYFTGWSTQNNGVVANLLGFIGDTYCSVPGNCQPGEVGSSKGMTARGTSDGQRWIASAGDAFYQPNSETMDEFWLQHTYVQPQYAPGPYIGSYLVRDASVVPIPAAAWLFGSGLIGLIGLARRKSFSKTRS